MKAKHLITLAAGYRCQVCPNTNWSPRRLATHQDATSHLIGHGLEAADAEKAVIEAEDRSLLTPSSD